MAFLRNLADMDVTFEALQVPNYPFLFFRKEKRELTSSCVSFRKHLLGDLCDVIASITLLK